MTKEQEVIKYIETRIKICNENADICDDNDFDEEATYLREESYMLETVLNMLKEKDKEIEKLKADNKKAWKLNANMKQRHLSDIFKINKKDKQIDLMAEYISKIDIEEDICIKNKTNPDWCNEDYTNCKNCIKQYFERKAKDGRN